MSKTRIKIPYKTKENLRRKNLGVCCVCKERGIGIEFHHIDENPSNNSEDNIAVLCTKEHDLHHRPQTYDLTKHRELGKDKILALKKQWEETVVEAQKDNPKLLAVINVYGTEESIHSTRFFIQTTDKEIIYERIYHLLQSSMEDWTDRIMEEIIWLGKNIKLTIIDKPLQIEYCPCCKKTLLSILDENVAIRLTTEDWKEKAIASIYINPKVTRITIMIFYDNDILFTGVLHKCNKVHLHFISENYEERVPITKNIGVRSQVTQIVAKICSTGDLDLASIFVGTGDENNPEILDDFNLPKFWEYR